MDKPKLFIKKEQPTISWVPPHGSVGSTLVYRATDNISDSTGSRTVLTTLDDSTTSYTDSASGSLYNVYRIQFWDGTGSSPLGDAISPRSPVVLADIGEIKTLARISDNYDLGSDEVYDAINDATNWVYREYGEPIKKTVIMIDSDDEDESYCYDFTGRTGPVYSIKRMTVNAPEEELVSGSSWIVDFNQGLIKFENAFTDDYERELVRMEWVPQIFNDLVKTKTVLDLLETGMVIDGADVTNTRIDKLKRQLEEMKNSIKPRGIWAPRQVTDKLIIDSSYSDASGWADYVGQKYDRRSLRFDND